MFSNRRSEATRDLPPALHHGCAAPTPEDLGAFEEDALSLEDALAARDPTEEARHG